MAYAIGMWILLVYILVLLTIGLLDARRIRGFDDYVLAGRNRGSGAVGASILASVVGASATMGVVKLAWQIGTPAFWWLGSGGLGLMLGGWLVAARVRASGARTLPDVADRIFGREVRFLVSVAIAIGWVGIVAAQFVAASRLIEAFCGIDYGVALVGTVLVMTVYCVLGGQASILRTDALQLGVLLVGLILTVVYLYWATPPPAETVSLRLLTPDFGPGMVAYFVFVIGSGFVIGPDIFGRYFAAADPGAARRAGVAAGAALVVVSVCVTAIGLWARGTVTGDIEGDVLSYVLLEHMPPGFALVMTLGLLSAIVSSADTCLLTASSIVEYDLLKRDSVRETRTIMVIIAILALVLAWFRREIIPHLLLAYHVFNCGVVPPLIVGLFKKPSRARIPLIITAVVVGGSLGVVASVTGAKMLALVGIFGSTVISVAAVWLPWERRASARQ